MSSPSTPIRSSSPSINSSPVRMEPDISRDILYLSDPNDYLTYETPSPEPIMHIGNRPEEIMSNVLNTVRNQIHELERPYVLEMNNFPDLDVEMTYLALNEALMKENLFPISPMSTLNVFLNTNEGYQPTGTYVQNTGHGRRVSTFMLDPLVVVSPEPSPNWHLEHTTNQSMDGGMDMIP